MAVAVGALLALLVAGDAISGERERGTLESLLLAPVSAPQLVAGKLLAALSLWLAALAITVPYVVVPGPRRRRGRRRDRRRRRSSARCSPSTFTALGIVISALARSNRLSLSVSLFTLLALYRADPAARRRQAGMGGRAAAAREPGDRGRALHRQGRHRPSTAGRRTPAGSLSPRSRPRPRLTFAAVVVAPRFMSLRGSALG